MAYAGNVSSVPSLRTWEQAHAWFEGQPQRRGRYWAPSERPLQSPRQHHYRIVRSSKGYALVHYHTALVFFEHPKEDGTRMVYVRRWPSVTSNALLWRFGFGKITRAATREGKELWFPVWPVHSDTWSAAICYDAQGFAIEERSEHIGLSYSVTTPERKLARRRALAADTRVARAKEVVKHLPALREAAQGRLQNLLIMLRLREPLVGVARGRLRILGNHDAVSLCDGEMRPNAVERAVEVFDRVCAFATSRETALSDMADLLLHYAGLSEIASKQELARAKEQALRPRELRLGDEEIHIKLFSEDVTKATRSTSVVIGGGV